VYSNDVIGWAPLSPQGFTNYGYGQGQGYGQNQGYGYGPSGFNVNVFIFVNERDFGAGNCADYALGPTSVSQVIARSRLRRSDRGPERDYIERRIGHRIEVAKVDSRTVQLDGKQVRLVTPVGVENDIRRYAPKVTQRALDQRFLQQRIEKVRRGEVRTNQEAVDRLFKQERRTDSGKRYEKGEIVHDQSGREISRAPSKVETKPDTRSSSSSGERYEKGQVVHDQSGREISRAPGKVETKPDNQGRANSGERYEKGQIVHDQSGREVIREPNSNESKQDGRKAQAREDSRSKDDQGQDQKAGDKKQQKNKKDKHNDKEYEPPNR
jgi:membrane-bound inhibitor of C-type lysozyme